MIAGSGSIGTDTKYAFFDNAGNLNIYSSGATIINNGFLVNGTYSGYTGSEVTLNSLTPSAVNAISDIASNTVSMNFDHRGTSNTGIWKWRNGSGAANTQMSLDATGNLTLAGAFVNANGTVIPSGVAGYQGPPTGYIQLVPAPSPTQPATCTVGQLWTNPSASSASTVLAVCYPANTWTYVTVP